MADEPDASASTSIPAEAEAAEPSTSSVKTLLTPQQISDKIMERVHKAETIKADGNDYYKNNDFRGAIGKYHRALLFVKGLDSMAQQDVVQRLEKIGRGSSGSDGTQNFGEIIGKLLPADIEKTVAGIEQGCYNNLAACLLQQMNPPYDRVIVYCDKVLATSPLNPKALYRKGQSLYHLHDYTNSLSTLKKARQSAKSDPHIKNYISLCEASIANQEKQEKVRYKAIFDKMAEEGEYRHEDTATASSDAS